MNDFFPLITVGKSVLVSRPNSVTLNVCAVVKTPVLHVTVDPIITVFFLVISIACKGIVGGGPAPLTAVHAFSTIYVFLPCVTVAKLVLLSNPKLVISKVSLEPGSNPEHVTVDPADTVCFLLLSKDFLGISGGIPAPFTTLQSFSTM